MKALPIGVKDVAPLFDDGELIFVDLINFCILALLFLLLHFTTQFCSNNPPVFGETIFVVSVICILFYLVRLYVSFPTNTLR